MTRPELHALLNGLAFLCLLYGRLVLRGRTGGSGDELVLRRHIGAMGTALAISAVFLVSYLEYHARIGHVPFWGEGWLLTVYRVVLLPHIVLAVAMLPMIAITLTHAFRRRWDAHRRWARRTWPVWAFVSVSGVAVYVLNFALRPAAQAMG